MFNAIKDNLILDAPKSPSETHCIVAGLLQKLQVITKKMPVDSLRDYEDAIFSLCKIIENSRSKFSGFSAVDLCKSFPVLNSDRRYDENSFLISLAHLSVIACTSSIWCKPERNTQAAAESAAHLLFPCLSTNIIKISYHDGLAKVPRICWAALFPDSFQKECKKSLGEETLTTNVDWFQYFIPDKYQTKHNRHGINGITGRSPSYFSNYWGGKPEGNACCKLICGNIIREGKKISGEYSKLLLHITNRCLNILSALPEDYSEKYQEDIDNLCKILHDNSGLISGFENIVFNDITTFDRETSTDTDKNGSSISIQDSVHTQIDLLSKKLSLLIIIAATWTIWINEKSKSLANDLSRIMFKQKGATNDKDLRAEIIKEENKKAKDRLKDAKEAFYENEFKKCGDLCREIITINLATEKNGKKCEIFDRYLQFDINSLNQTSDIIRTSWFTEKKSQKNIPDEAER